MNQKKKILIGLGIMAALVIGYWLASPLWRTERISESLEEIAPQSPAPTSTASTDEANSTEPIKTVSQGNFSGLLGHSAEGRATLIKSGDKYYVRLEDNFRVTNGPDLFVHLGKNGEYASEARLGALKGNIGGQNYEVPANIDISNYNEVWIWCRAFAVPFGKAVLK